jgi:hypothetical protein
MLAVRRARGRPPHEGVAEHRRDRLLPHVDRAWSWTSESQCLHAGDCLGDSVVRVEVS